MSHVIASWSSHVSRRSVGARFIISPSLRHDLMPWYLNLEMRLRPSVTNATRLKSELLASLP
jgi:2-keto-3-deoxy-6-phosphogluconate aldolase